ncbi:MAG TPA: hypothetical protein VM759_10715 [Longimicrobium sp.]|nr:hypothetical protein [Longimicrobium sp.]
MEYRGYTGTVGYDLVERVFHGEVMGLRDIITYETDCEALLEVAFHEAVDAYLDACRACGEAPEPPPPVRAARPVSPSGESADKPDGPMNGKRAGNRSPARRRWSTRVPPVRARAAAGRRR